MSCLPRVRVLGPWCLVLRPSKALGPSWADRGGVYTVVLASKPSAKPVRYTVRVADVRTANDADRARVSAVAAFAEGDRLTLERTASSYRGAIPKYERAAAQWKAAGDRPE